MFFKSKAVRSTFRSYLFIFIVFKLIELIYIYISSSLLYILESVSITAFVLPIKLTSSLVYLIPVVSFFNSFCFEIKERLANSSILRYLKNVTLLL